MPEIFAEIITIGDELLYGQTVDTNSAWIGTELSKLGISLKRITTVSDKVEDIMNAIDTAEKSSSIIFITGGLGPTSDDITKHTLAKYFNTELKKDESVIEDLKALFRDRPHSKVIDNEVQAMLPANCVKLRNKVGTAPGMWFKEREIIVVSMPGVPYEMKYLMQYEVLPRLKKELQLPIIAHSIVHTVGVPEVKLSERLQDFEKQLPAHIALAYLPSLGQVKLRLTARGKEKELMEKELAEHTQRIVEIARKYVYGFGDTSLETEVGKLLAEQHLTIATAESCSGGRLANTIVNVPGSSRYFDASIIAYSYDAKHRLLGVSMDMLNEVGAVSEDCAIQMAEGVRERLGSDIGISSTGIAGPGGGTEEKPVGTVWIACSDGKRTLSKKLTLGDKGRLINMELTTTGCLHLIWRMLTNTEV